MHDPIVTYFELCQYVEPVVLLDALYELLDLTSIRPSTCPHVCAQGLKGLEQFSNGLSPLRGLSCVLMRYILRHSFIMLNSFDQ